MSTQTKSQSNDDENDDPTTLTDSSIPSTNTDTTKPHVIIAGAGIMGCATAYYLARDFGVASTLVDPSGRIAPAASGRAGGFLSLDMNDHSPVGPLARRSFALHQELANELPDPIDYRRVTCAAIGIGQRSTSKPQGQKLKGIEWAEGARGVQPLGDESTTAQVHPDKLCQALWRQTQQLAPGCRLVQGRVVGPVVEKSEDDTDDQTMVMTGAEILVQDDDDNDTTTTTTTKIPGTKLVYASGPWTSSAMTGVKYHSVVVPTPTVLTQCVFFSGLGDPEVYVRPDQTAYCTGFPDNPVRVTERPGEEVVRPEKVQQILDAVRQTSNLVLDNGDDDGSTNMINNDMITQSCYLPCTPDGLPFLGQWEADHSYIVTGHSCWGILMGPASGEALAHLIVTGRSPHVDLTPFDPHRLGPMNMLEN